MSGILAFVNAGYFGSIRLVTWLVKNESSGAYSFIHRREFIQDLVHREHSLGLILQC